MLLYLYVSSMVGIYASLKVPSMNRKTKLVLPTPENIDLNNGEFSLSWYIFYFEPFTAWENTRQRINSFCLIMLRDKNYRIILFS